MAIEAPAQSAPLRDVHGELETRLSPAVQLSLKKAKWTNRLSSGWAPVTVFGIAFLIYLPIVEFHTASHTWAQPALKAFGSLMLAWLVGIIIARTLIGSFSRVRKLRHQSWEFVAETSTLLEKYRPKMNDNVVEEVIASCVVLNEATAQPSEVILSEKLKAGTETADKHLASWRRKSAFEMGAGFVKAIALALLIRAVLIEPYRIPSGSMIPTLEIGDQIFVNKFIYGVRLPKLNIVPFVIVRPPERGDVIVFNNPKNTDDDFIKRVAGVPGDKVEVRNGVVFVNDVAQPRELVEEEYVYYDKDTMRDGPWSAVVARRYLENLNDKKHWTLERPFPPPEMIQGPYIVPEKHVFVLGDNRDNSADSRSGFGVSPKVEYVPFGNIKGKAMVIWFATGHDGFLSSYFDGTGIQTSRFFLPVR